MTQFPGGVILQLVGDIDVSTMPQFQKAVRESMDDEAHSLVLDFSGVDLVDAVSLGVVLEAIKKTQLRRGRLAVVDPSAAAHREFELTRLSEIVETYPTIAAAVAALT
ncbi:MAG: hypothetical protein RLZZ31_436 [Actinomycetota bacterium]